MSLVALPSQPDGVAWPTEEWPRGDSIARVDALVDEMFGDAARYETTYAVVIVVGGRVIAERYGGAGGNDVGARDRRRRW